MPKSENHSDPAGPQAADRAGGLTIAFMGTPDFAVPALNFLIGSRHSVVCVYTQPPRPKGRGHRVVKSPVHLLAEENGIQVETPQSFRRNDRAVEKFREYEADIAVVAAYGLILPGAVLKAPKFGCLNIHASLLPRWRGASPIQQAIWHGDDITGVSIMQMEKGLDTGPVLDQADVPVHSDTTAPSLHYELAALGAARALEILDRIAAGTMPEPHRQNDDEAVYAPLLSREDGKIDWSRSATEIDRQIRALNPWPGVWTESRFDQGHHRHKILQARAVDMHIARPPGTLADKSGHVACGGDTAIKIDKIHPAGANKPMDILDAINGQYIRVNQTFEID